MLLTLSATATPAAVDAFVVIAAAATAAATAAAAAATAAAAAAAATIDACAKDLITKPISPMSQNCAIAQQAAPSQGRDPLSNVLLRLIWGRDVLGRYKGFD